MFFIFLGSEPKPVPISEEQLNSFVVNYWGLVHYKKAKHGYI